MEPYAIGKSWEYWLLPSGIYRNAIGNRGPMESGKPSNARWECYQHHWEHYKAMMLAD